MSSPRAIIQILITGGQIVGKALAAGARQAYKNAQHRPAGFAEETSAAGGSATDKITRETKMTVDEAHLILNRKQGSDAESLASHYEHLFKVNSPPPPPAPSEGATQKFTSSRAVQNYHSHYLLSKVVRAKERIELEMRTQMEKDLKVTEMEGGTAKEEMEGTTKKQDPPPPSTPPPS